MYNSELPPGWETRKTSGGLEYQVQVQDMPLIRNEYLECVVYLYSSEDAAKSDEHAGGTAFIVSMHSEAGHGLPPHIYLVTNRHMVKRAKKDDDVYLFARINTRYGKTEPLNTEGTWTWDDQDDLAVAPVSLPEYSQHISLSDIADFLTDDKIEEYQIGIGDDVFMVSRLVGNEGKAASRNAPVARFGNISKLPDPDDPIQMKSGNQVAYIVEMHSVGGCSGSPVFFYIPGHRMPDGKMRSRQGVVIVPLLMGVDCGHRPDLIPVLSEQGRAHHRNLYVEANSGMAIVVPTSRLIRLLNKPKLVKGRREADAINMKAKKNKDNLNARRGIAVEDSKKKPEEFTRHAFEDALKRSSRKNISEHPSKDSDKTKQPLVE